MTATKILTRAFANAKPDAVGVILKLGINEAISVIDFHQSLSSSDNIFNPYFSVSYKL